MVRYKVSEIAAKRFNKSKRFSSNNTKVVVDKFYVRLYLFGYEIAQKNIATGVTFINFKGWKTQTTVDRLEALTGLKFSIAKKDLCYFIDNTKIYIDSNTWYIVNTNGEKTWLESLKY